MTPEDLVRRLGPDAVAEFKRALMSRIVLTVEANVKRVTPVRTGTLRRSITSRVMAAGERGAVGTNLNYARPVNTRRRYMERGLEDSRAAVERLAKEAGEELFRRVAS